MFSCRNAMLPGNGERKGIYLVIKRWRGKLQCIAVLVLAADVILANIGTQNIPRVLVVGKFMQQLVRAY